MTNKTTGADNTSTTKAQDLEEDIQYLNNPVLTVEPVVKKYLTAVKGYTQENNTFYFTDGDAKVEVRVISDEIIRVRLAPHGTFLDDFSYAVPDAGSVVTVFKISEDEQCYTVSTNTISCIISKSNFHISFADINAVVLNEDASPVHWEENVDYGG